MIEHKLAVNKDTKPVKQILRKQSKEKLEFIISVVDKLIEAGVIRAVPHPTWVANPVVVPKPMTFKWRLCIDFTDLNNPVPRTRSHYHGSTSSSTLRLGASSCVTWTPSLGTIRS